MANVYRVNILSIEPAANGLVNADVVVEQRISANPDTWKEILNGHRTLVLEAADIEGIVNSPLYDTNAKRRQAINALIKSKVLEWGVDIADQAYQDMTGLYVFPFNVIVRQ